MPKKRVYEIAKELNINNKDVLKVLDEWGMDIKTHMGSVDNETSEKLLKHFDNNDKKETNSEKPIAEKLDSINVEEKKTTEQKAENKPLNQSYNQNQKREYKQGDQQRSQYNKPQGDQQRPPYNKPQGDQQRPPYNKPQGDQQRPPYNKPQGDQQRPPYNKPQGDQQRPPYNKPQGDQQRPPYNKPQGDQQRPPYNKPQGDQQRPPYNKPQGQGYQQRPPYNKPQGQGGQRPGFKSNEQRPNFQKGNDNKDKKPFQDRKVFDKKDEVKTTETANEKNKSKEKFNKKQEFKKVVKVKEKEIVKEEKLVQIIKPKIKEEIKEDEIKIIKVPLRITLKDFSEKIGKPTSLIIKTLMLKVNIMATINQEIDLETAAIVAEEFGFLVEEEIEENIEEMLNREFFEGEDKEEDLVNRPPVVVVMGHVDHGKTSLLDSIRKSSVVSNEAGGITQHIGAYTVSIDGKTIAFLDTPGHEAFTAMRMRGAQVTDIAVLVVAADDGVMPQTIEAINHAKAAKVDIIVAINKIDKPSANLDRVKQELVEYGLVSEDWGGETICVPVSAMNKTGIDTLLEMILLVADMKELKSNPYKKARGTVIEALLDKGRGPVATVLVQEGTLHVGDPIMAGTCFGKIRAMMDDKGRKVKKAGPSTPVEILGLSDVPSAGDLFFAAGTEKQARQVAESVVSRGRIDMIKDSTQKVSLDDLFSQIQSGNVKDLNIVIKADVQGSAEAVRSSLERLSTDEVRIRTIHSGVGAITESDVMLAAASNAIIIGFNVRPETTAKSMAEDQKVDLRLYRVIYGAIEDISLAMKGMLDPIFEEKIIGHAEIRQLFKVSSVGTIGGSHVTDGKITRSSKVRILRDHIVIFDGDLAALKRFKDDVKEVNIGYECGLLFYKFNDIREGDIVEAYIMQEIPR